MLNTRRILCNYGSFTIQDKDVDLSLKIEEGFCPDGLGNLSIFYVPSYASLRQNLMNLAPRLASLPEEVLKELEDPQSSYADLLKGSFYANPIIDKPTTEDSLIQSVIGN